MGVGATIDRNDRNGNGAPGGPDASDARPRAVRLRVAEGRPKDSGRGIARMDPGDYRPLGASSGDIVQIIGRRSTVARLLPSHPQDRGAGVIQIDGVIRQNARTGLGEEVEVRLATCREAEEVDLACVLAPRSRQPGFLSSTDLLSRALEDMPLVAGDRVRAFVFGPTALEFKVMATKPAGPVIVTSDTRFSFRQEGIAGPGGPRMTYEDIGGLAHEVSRIREMVELPLRYPEVFDRLGIDAPKGVLLHGAPGTGKTLIARAVAGETEANFFHVNGPEIMNKFYGESEARLREIFEEARKRAPSIVFIDEIDAIAPKREEVVGEVEKRVTAQLLALMDGLESRGQVIVIGATNIPNALDPALRRPGRFDREIALGVPDKKGRLEILQIHTRGMPLAQDVDLEAIAGMTHGFVGADLESLCKEAAMIVLRRVLPRIDFTAARISRDTLDSITVRMEDFREALKEVEPSVTREVLVEVPEVRWSDVGGLKQAKNRLTQAVEWPIKYPDLLEKVGMRPPRGVLIYGPPGTGKTLLVKAVATECEANFISVKGPELLSKWVGDSEKGIREVFRKARQAAPCIVFFDEVDALFHARGGGFDSGVGDRVLAQFLTEMDGLSDLKGVVVMAATSRPDLLDPALTRAGRLEVHVGLGLPAQDERLDILRIHTRRKPLAKDVDLEWLATLTEGLPGSELAGICEEAAMMAVEEALSHGLGRGTAEAAMSLVVRRAHFEKALARRGLWSPDGQVRPHETH